MFSLPPASGNPTTGTQGSFLQGPFALSPATGREPCWLQPLATLLEGDRSVLPAIFVQRSHHYLSRLAFLLPPERMHFVPTLSVQPVLLRNFRANGQHLTPTTLMVRMCQHFEEWING